MTAPAPPAEAASQLPGIGTSQPGVISTEFGKSIIRLNLREWIIAVVIMVLTMMAVPWVGNRWERAPVDLDGRVSYSESEDYWQYRQRIEDAVHAQRIPIIGDSVVWGDYVLESETLSSYLNALGDTPQFANAGVNGAHPLALSGLVEYYTGDLRNQAVILHCNLLWLSSPERDLQIDKDIPINHTRLIPQFLPRIPAYQAAFSQRLGIAIDRALPFFDYITHLRTRDFDGKDLERWSLVHPYENPLSRVWERPAAAADELRHRPVPWTEQGIRLQDFSWVDLSSSLQWHAWRQSAHRLIARGNRLFVLVGPLNEHLLTPESRQTYGNLKQGVIAWLEEQKIPRLAPELLPSEEYGDASHPLKKGYRRLAQNIADDSGFREWLRFLSASR